MFTVQKIHRSIFVSFLMASCFSVSAFAQESQVSGQSNLMQTNEELQIQQKARKRLYPGGRDEEPLKVQAQLPQPQRKMAPVTDVPSEPEATESEHD